VALLGFGISVAPAGEVAADVYQPRRTATDKSDEIKAALFTLALSPK